MNYLFHCIHLIVEDLSGFNCVCVSVCFSGAVPAGSGEAGGRVAEGATRCNWGIQKARGKFVWVVESNSGCSHIS